ncbi:hypothetical protein AVEN_100384-1 [Araneus ventricosus]|uniref:Uncharacterized protein n=1 Tax=Araneus ventricosus TaxID=182803 RepID=A0A4Y2MM74_ARAVE|nr:hypothetical protein AVEN_100384-1 [Araneus ventricosus]
MNLKINYKNEKEKGPEALSINCLLTIDENKNLTPNVSSAIESCDQIAEFFQPTTRARISEIRNTFIKIRLNNEEIIRIFLRRIHGERNDLETAGRGISDYKIHLSIYHVYPYDVTM